jgi:hypothetical protein
MPPAIPTAPVTAGTAIRAIAPRPALPLEPPLLDALERRLAPGAAVALCRLEELALRAALVLRPSEELARVLRVPDARALPLRLLPLLRELALRLLPLLRVLPLLDPLAFWFLARPRVDACRLPPPVDLFDPPRLLERLEEPRPPVAAIVHLLRFDSHLDELGERVWQPPTPQNEQVPPSLDECSMPLAGLCSAHGRPNWVIPAERGLSSAGGVRGRRPRPRRRHTPGGWPDRWP